MAEESHEAVLVREVKQFLVTEERGIYVDATLGAGGHTEAILATYPQVRVLGMDQDEEALKIARIRLERFSDRCQFAKSSFAQIDAFLKQWGYRTVDGILIDLGVSSMQLDRPERGFSFLRDGPLDMRMDQSQTLTAADVVNGYREEDLAEILHHFGEEPRSRSIARVIVRSRPIRGTCHLADVVLQAKRVRARSKIHPATLTFQALRIYVNDELGSLQKFLEQVPNVLAPSGRLVTIGFHSLEDRLIKQHVKLWAQTQLFRVLTKHVVRPREEEVRRNPRSRSARLRAVERI